MFLSGQPGKAEMRPPSFKGALRFWYRAIALSHHQNKIKKVRLDEEKLFGTTENQGLFLLKIRNIGSIKSSFQEEKWGNGELYLGYGLFDKNKPSRHYLKENHKFEVTLLCKENNESINLLKEALIALGLFGGLGSRTRRGFGSISLETLKQDGDICWQGPKNLEELEDKIKKFINNLGHLSDKLPEYSAFSNKSYVVIVDKADNSKDLLNKIGEEMLNFRKENRGNDGKLAWKALDAEDNKDYPKTHPKRVVFGLPHNYFFKDQKRGIRIVPQNDKVYGRRASPLIIHIHKLEREYVGVMLTLPARFLPEGVGISYDNKHTVPVNVDYRMLHQFINSFLDKREVWGNG